MSKYYEWYELNYRLGYLTKEALTEAYNWGVLTKEEYETILKTRE